MGCINIFLKLSIALCFYIFLNTHVNSSKNSSYTFNVSYCIQNDTKDKKSPKINELNIKTGLEMISNRLCIKFLKQPCYEEKKNCTIKCTKTCPKKCKVSSICEKQKKCKKSKNCKKQCTKKKICKKQRKCKKPIKKCTTSCSEISLPLNITPPFIRFLYDKKNETSDYYFNASATLCKEKVYDMKINDECNKKPGCVTKKVMMYLGLIPTVRRRDRNYHIFVLNDDIDPKYRMEYSILGNVSLADIDYDFSSIAHFPDTYRALKNKRTYFRKQLNDSQVKVTGQEIGPAFTDLKWLYFAHCKNKFYSSVKCFNDAYPKSDGSNECECPTGYTGKTCEDLEFKNSSCSKRINITESRIKKQLNFSEIANCTVELIAPKEKQIRISVLETNCTSKNPCFEHDCLQIKYFRDMATTGLCLCGQIKSTSLYTHGNKGLIQYTGKQKGHYAYLEYYAYP
uniref:EGF-like domain-containing protein n=1 Tax=Strongyloides papillosus TaxID=174720 RepID=A0A0N5BKX0_STREA